MLQASHSPHNSERRTKIFEELGLLPYLSRRRPLQLGELPLHCELYYTDTEAPTLIFLPGIGTYSELYCETLAKLCDRGYNLIGVDLRGHGYSGGPRGHYRVEQVIADVGEVIDYLEQQFNGPLGIFGCSLGARLGLAVAEADPRVRALLCHTLFLAELPPDLWHSLGWSWLGVSSLFMPSLKVSFRQFVNIEDMLTHNPMGRYANQDDRLVWDYPLSTLKSVYNYPSRILQEALNIPSAILIGERDEVIPIDYTRALIRRSDQPFELIEIPGAAHMLPFEHIDETVEAAAHWFDRAFAGA